MTAEHWATIVTSVVIPIVLRILVHYFPWLADAADRKGDPLPRGGTDEPAASEGENG